MNRFWGAPEPDANTTARPIGWPQPNVVARASIGGRSGASALRPRTRKPPRSTRSPCGPHANGPGSRTANRHETASVVGSSAQARPAETNATVCEAAAPFGHPLGSGEPSARIAPTGAGCDVALDVADGADDGVLVPPCVQAPTR